MKKVTIKNNPKNIDTFKLESIEVCNDKGEYIMVNCEDVETYIQTISCLKHRINELECLRRADNNRVNEQKRLIQRFKDDLIKAVINFSKEDFIKGVIDYQFENSRGFKNGI